MRDNGASSSQAPEASEEAEVEMRSITQLQDSDLGPEAPLISAQPAADTSSDRDLAEEAASSRPRSSGSTFVWILTYVACVSGLLFGYDTGVISATMVSIGSDLSGRPLTSWDKSLITSSTSLFALIASPVAGVLADRCGRKMVIVTADVLFAAGALCQTVTGTVSGMILGRSLLGLAIGAASFTVPLYIAELAPGHLRGRLVTVSLLFITGGQVVAYVVGWLLSTVPAGWRWMVGLGALPAIVQSVMLISMPESPRWLTKAGQEDQARRVLRKVYQGEEDMTQSVEQTLTSIKAEILAEEGDQDKASSTSKLSALLLHPPNARALTIACLLQGLQQLCGFNSLMYFSATIFSSLQFSSPTLTSLSIAVTNFVATNITLHLIDRVGRRRMLLYTIPGMSLSLGLCALAFRSVPASSFDPKSSPPSPPPPPPPSDGHALVPNQRLPALLILVSLLLYVVFYATGLGPIPWQQSELFPLAVRSLGSSISTATNWTCNFVVGLTFLPLMGSVGPFATFVAYAAVCLVGWAAVWWIYPETMGLELEDVAELLRHGWGVRRRRRRRRSRGSGQAG